VRYAHSGCGVVWGEAMGIGKSKIKTQRAKLQSKYQNGSTSVGLVKGIERIGRGLCAIRT